MGGKAVGGELELRSFAGAWSLCRRVRHDAGWEAAFQGRLLLAPHGEGLRHLEEGTLRMPGRPPMEARRRLLWRPDPRGVAVLFADGRPFHRIDLRHARPKDVHPCGADLYRVAYDLSAWPRWSVRWRVDGPRHAYTMVTRHAPLAGAGAMGHAPAVAREDAHDP